MNDDLNEAYLAGFKCGRCKRILESPFERCHCATPDPEWESQ